VRGRTGRPQHRHGGRDDHRGTGETWERGATIRPVSGVHTGAKRLPFGIAPRTDAAGPDARYIGGPRPPITPACVSPNHDPYMTHSALERPSSDEYAPYFAKYVDLVPVGDVLEVLAAGARDTRALLGSIPDGRSHFRYAPGKWSVREVVGHLSDTERVLAYRMLRIARGDVTPLPGFDENAYVASAEFDARSMEDLLEELYAVRHATLLLVRSLTPGSAARTGMANERSVSARALAWIIAGHELHHRRILEERYAVHGH